ncbi:hypothetical protein [Streptosporangium sp. 'caverna']|uniref:hypothetical protein n=1 Tax=Streptosporangium sp. 'caverna' TaxID=2202249 RepID=UPI0013A69E26|nr:hypothetical protein [Streptosporangium sp. 'caverna']
MSKHGSRRKVVSALGVTIVVAVAAIAATGAFIAGGSDSGPDATATAPTPMTWRKDACVRRKEARFDLVSCAGADGRVTSVGARASDCPADTDEFVRIETVARGTVAGSPGAGGTSRTACVRNLGPTHSGDPGAGGGLLRAGDCVALRGGERPCAEEGWYGRAVAVVDRAADCPERTLDTLIVGPGAVACLGRGGRVLTAGNCVAEPDSGLVSRETLVRTSCESAAAWAKVTARARSLDGCPEGSDRYLRARERNVYRPVICLRRVALGDST